MPGTRLEALFGAASSMYRWDPRPDEELLTRFLDQRDEAAFEVLLVRHGPGVRAACRGWLRATADIEDAAQATFLVLVQRARAIRDQRAVGRWLYGVAANVARRLKKQQKPIDPLPADVPARSTVEDLELRDLLTEEVARLPEKYRLPVQLCYWAGLTTAEAALRLGVPKGTVLTRLAWARKRLHKCLTKSGVALAASLGLAAAPAVSAAWLRTTARAATCLLAGGSPAHMGISERTISLTEGVVRAMIHDKLKHMVVVLLLLAGLTGFGLYQWGKASDGAAKETKTRNDAALAVQAAKGEDARPGPVGRRREAVIKLPVGSFIKEVEVPQYGSARMMWTYEDEHLIGHLQGTALGGELDVTIEAEYSLSSNGTIYGLITGVHLNILRLPDLDNFADLKPFVSAWPVIEPLINEVMVDLPFSYQFRLQSDRVVVSNVRILLAGPNPIGKVGGWIGNSNDPFMLFLAYFQALGAALEGTYTATDGKAVPPIKRQQLQFPKTRGQGGAQQTVGPLNSPAAPSPVHVPN
jgi:RNA polymerase sigma factor (sigma-70 family)